MLNDLPRVNKMINRIEIIETNIYSLAYMGHSSDGTNIGLGKNGAQCILCHICMFHHPIKVNKNSHTIA